MATQTQQRPDIDGSDHEDDFAEWEKELQAPDSAEETEAQKLDAQDEPDELEKAENEPANNSLNYNDNGEGEGEQPQTRRQRLKSLVKRRRLLLAGLGSFFGFLALILILLFILGSLPLSTTAVLLERQLDRSLRDSATSSEQVVEDKATLDSTSDQQNQNFLQRINKLADPVIKTYKTLSVKQTTARLIEGTTFNYVERHSVGGLSIQRLDSITIGDKTFTIPANTTPVTGKFSVDYIRNRIDSAKGIKNALRQSLLDESSSGGWASRFKRFFLIDFRAIRAAADQIHAQKWRWTTKQLQESEQSAEESDIVNQQISYEEATDNGQSIVEAENGATDDVKAVVDEAAQQEQACFQDDNCTESVIQQGGGEPAQVTQTISNGFQPSILTRVFSKVNTIWMVLAPLCTFYNNSIPQSGDVIDANLKSAERTFWGAEAGSSQQAYDGYNGTNTVKGQAIGGYVRQMNGLTSSDAYKGANNEPVDTTTTTSAEMSASGTFSSSVFNFLPSGIATALNKIVGPICTVFGSPWTGVAILAGQIGVNLLPGIGEVTVGGGTVAADATSQFIASKIALTVGSAVRNFFTKKELTKFVTFAGVEDAASYLGRVVAMQHMAAPDNGTARGTPYLNQANMGGNALNGTLEQQENFGRPVDNTEVNQVKVSDAAFTKENNSEKSAYDRYLALDNPQSLLVHMATAIGGELNVTNVSSLFSVPARIFNFSFVSQIASILHPSLASAISGTDTGDYNLVQWAWTPDEENAYEHDANYEMVHNEEVLEASGKEQEISDKYSKCFTETMGQLLSSGDIQRDPNTNAVIDGAGDCSPDQLGMHNPQYGDLVFRWRVARRNDSGLQELLKIQNAQNIRPLVNVQS